MTPNVIKASNPTCAEMGKYFQDHPQDRPAANDGIAQVPLKDIAYISDELHVKRLIKAKPGPCPLNHLVRRDNRFHTLIHHFNRVARSDVAQNEDDHQHHEEQGNQGQQSDQEIFGHSSPPARFDRILKERVERREK